ncbi:MAG: DUF4282 domain-containing protein [Planctomycetota bacterium]|nr:DUF4282 domain-containing protein [Planctomycetota bacterium]
MQDFLRFKKMITPLMIQVLFGIGVVLCLIVGLLSVVAGFDPIVGGAGPIAIGLLIIVLGPVAVRVYCELLIIGFSINDTLTDIKNKMRDTIE